MSGPPAPTARYARVLASESLKEIDSFLNLFDHAWRSGDEDTMQDANGQREILLKCRSHVASLISQFAPPEQEKLTLIVAEIDDVLSKNPTLIARKFPEPHAAYETYNQGAEAESEFGLGSQIDPNAFREDRFDTSSVGMASDVGDETVIQNTFLAPRKNVVLGPTSCQGEESFDAHLRRNRVAADVASQRPRSVNESFVSLPSIPDRSDKIPDNLMKNREEVLSCRPKTVPLESAGVSERKTSTPSFRSVDSKELKEKYDEVERKKSVLVDMVKQLGLEINAHEQEGESLRRMAQEANGTNRNQTRSNKDSSVASWLQSSPESPFVTPAQHSYAFKATKTPPQSEAIAAAERTATTMAPRNGPRVNTTDAMDAMGATAASMAPEKYNHVTFDSNKQRPNFRSSSPMPWRSRQAPGEGRRTHEPRSAFAGAAALPEVVQIRATSPEKGKGNADMFGNSIGQNLLELQVANTAREFLVQNRPLEKERFTGDGDDIDFESTLNRFELVTGQAGVTKLQRFMELPFHFAGSAGLVCRLYERVREPGEGLEKTLKHLKADYGRRNLSAQRMLDKLLRGNQIERNDYDSINKFILALQLVYQRAIETNRENSFNTEDTIAQLLRQRVRWAAKQWGKIRVRKREKWDSDDENDDSNQFREFLDFLKQQNSVNREERLLLGEKDKKRRVDINAMNAEPRSTDFGRGRGRGNRNSNNDSAPVGGGNRNFRQASAGKDAAVRSTPVRAAGYAAGGGNASAAAAVAAANAAATNATAAASKNDKGNVAGAGIKVDWSCTCCRGIKFHSLDNCATFVKKNQQEKFAVLKAGGLCLVCLQKGHVGQNCESKNNCSSCGGRHHQVMCRGKNTA